jgi:pimeloyl-ACP methyl ester carboxylesterase
MLPTFRTAGARVHTVDLPSASKSTLPRFGLHVDAEVVRWKAEQIDGPVVAVAHSYGGAAATQGLAGLTNVRHIVYLAAFALDIGESGESILGGNLPSWWATDGEVIMPTDAVNIFYHDVAADEAERATAQLMPFSMSAVRQRLTMAAWRTIPSTYIVCQNDRAVPVETQEYMAARVTTDIHRRAWSHSPYLSHPEALARLIIAIATKAMTRA